MSKYEELKQLPPAQFRRLTGVKSETFSEVVNILIAVQNSRYRKAGYRACKWVEDTLDLFRNSF